MPSGQRSTASNSRSTKGFFEWWEATSITDLTVYDREPAPTVLLDHRGNPIPRITDTKLGFIGFQELKERR